MSDLSAFRFPLSAFALSTFLPLGVERWTLDVGRLRRRQACSILCLVLPFGVPATAGKLCSAFASGTNTDRLIDQEYPPSRKASSFAKATARQDGGQVIKSRSMSPPALKLIR